MGVSMGKNITLNEKGINIQLCTYIFFLILCFLCYRFNIYNYLTLKFSIKFCIYIDHLLFSAHFLLKYFS